MKSSKQKPSTRKKKPQSAGSKVMSWIQDRKILVSVAAIVAFAGLGAWFMSTSNAATSPPDHNINTPVLYIHGIVASAGCPGLKTAKQAAPLKTVLTANGYKGTLVPIDYYCGDNTGISIRGAGGPSTPEFPQNGYNATTPIERLGFDLSWFIYNTYTVKGQPVSVVAHSMGGLITAYAVTHAGQPNFPPTLLVQDVVTFSTPYGGVDEAPSPLTPQQYATIWCGSYAECSSLVPGSPFLTELASQVVPAAIDWTTIGGSPKDIMTYAASSAISADHKVNYYSKIPVDYGHSAYLTDTSNMQNMPAKITEGSGVTWQITNGAHSLKWGAAALMWSTY